MASSLCGKRTVRSPFKLSNTAVCKVWMGACWICVAGSFAEVAVIGVLVCADAATINNSPHTRQL